jgi:hypothetical protein
MSMVGTSFLLSKTSDMATLLVSGLGVRYLQTSLRCFGELGTDCILRIRQTA